MCPEAPKGEKLKKIPPVASERGLEVWGQKARNVQMACFHRRAE